MGGRRQTLTVAVLVCAQLGAPWERWPHPGRAWSVQDALIASVSQHYLEHPLCASTWHCWDQ